MIPSPALLDLLGKVRRYVVCYRCGVVDFPIPPLPGSACWHPSRSQPMVLATDYDDLAREVLRLRNVILQAEEAVNQMTDAQAACERVSEMLSRALSPSSTVTL